MKKITIAEAQAKLPGSYKKKERSWGYTSQKFLIYKNLNDLPNNGY